jgi:hypothetical protein
MEFLRRLLGLTTESENGLYSIRSMYHVPARIGSSVINKDGNIGRIIGSKKGEWGYEIVVENGEMISFYDPTDLKYSYFDLFL